MTKLLTLMLSFGLVHVALAQENVRPPEGEARKPNEDPKHKEAVDILKKVDAATKALTTVSYKASTQGEGWLASRVTKMEGTVVASGKWESELGKLRVDAKATMPDSAESRAFSIGNTGEEFYLIDPDKKLVYADLDPQVMGSDGRLATNLLMREFNHPTPFSDEINSEKAEIIGSEKVGDQDCYVINVNYSPKVEAVWYFSKKDFLPRRVDRINLSPTGERGKGQLIVTDLVTDVKNADTAFNLAIPEGYEKTDEFAPLRQRPNR